MMDTEYVPPPEEKEDDEPHAYNTRASSSKPDKEPAGTRTTRSSKFSSIKDLKEDKTPADDEEEGQRSVLCDFLPFFLFTPWMPEIIVYTSQKFGILLIFGKVFISEKPH